MSVPVSSNLSMLLGLNGQGLNEGQVYVGTPNTDPQTNAQATFWDPALTIPANQPLSVLGGYFSYLGSPAQPYTAAAFSIKVLDKKGVQVLERPYVAPSVVYNVRDFGAYGDGTHDDTTAIQAALTASGTGATVYFPPGTYLVSATLQALTNQSLLGAGPNSTIIKRFADYGSTVNFASAGAATVSGIWFEHSTLPTQGATALANKATSGAHLNVTDCQGLLVENCWFWRLPYAINLHAGASVTIRRCNAQGVWDGNYAAMQEGITSIAVGSSGYIQLVNIEDCYFGGSASAVRNVTWTSTDTGAHNFNIAQNIGAQAAVQIFQCEGLKIRGSYFGGQYTASIVSGLGLGAAAAEWRITNNFFDGAGTSSGIIQISSTDNSAIVNGVVISENTFNGEQQAYQAIQFLNASGAGSNPVVTNFVITSNTFQAIVGTPIVLFHARGGVIGHNSITAYNSRNVSAGGDPLFSAAIYASTAAASILIVGNILGGSINGDTPTDFCFNGVIRTGNTVFEKNTVWNGVGSTGTLVGKVDKITATGGAANYQLIGYEDVLLMSNTAPRTVTPPATLSPGYTITIKDAAGNAAAQTTTFIGTVDGAVNPAFNVNWFVRTLLWTGATWLIIGN